MTGTELFSAEIGDPEATRTVIAIVAQSNPQSIGGLVKSCGVSMSRCPRRGFFCAGFFYVSGR